MAQQEIGMNLAMLSLEFKCKSRVRSYRLIPVQRKVQERKRN